jgi:hypothetical protein
VVLLLLRLVLLLLLAGVVVMAVEWLQLLGSGKGMPAVAASP